MPAPSPLPTMIVSPSLTVRTEGDEAAPPSTFQVAHGRSRTISSVVPVERSPPSSMEGAIAGPFGRPRRRLLEKGLADVDAERLAQTEVLARHREDDELLQLVLQGQ